MTNDKENNEAVTKEQLLEPLKGAVDYLELVIEKKELISEPLTVEDYATAFEELNNFINGINELNQLLSSVGDLLNIKYENLSYEEGNLENYIEQFNQFLADDLIPAMENQDYMLLADLVEYELETYLNIYKKVFVKLVTYVEQLEFKSGSDQ